MSSVVVDMYNIGIQTVQEARGACWHQCRWNMASQTSVRLGISSGHWREDVHSWPDVGAGSNEHVHYWLHDDFLQVSCVAVLLCW